MSVWTYCHVCDSEMDTPNLKDKLRGYYNCLQCGSRVDTGYSRDDSMEDLADYLERLENRIEDLESKLE